MYKNYLTSDSTPHKQLGKFPNYWKSKYAIASLKHAFTYTQEHYDNPYWAGFLCNVEQVEKSPVFTGHTSLSS